MPTEYRIASIGGMWFLATIALSAVFIGAGLQGELTTLHIVFASTIFLMGIIGTLFLLRWFNKFSDSETDIAKAKRQRIDDMIRDMSDEDLVELKKRLSDGDIEDEELLDYVSEDGELVFRN